MSDLNSILSDEDDLPEEELTEEAEAPEEETEEGQEETEQQDEPAAEAPKAKEDEPEKSVPLAALQAERNEKRELARRLEEYQRNQPREEPKVPDVFEDQHAYTQHLQQQFEQARNNDRLNMSEAMARELHGDEAVDAAFEAVKAAGITQQFLQDRHPWGAVVKWHDKQQKMAEIGDDPEGWKAKERERIRQELQAELVAENVKSAASAKAPSLAGKSNLGSRQGGEWQGPSSLDDILAG